MRNLSESVLLVFAILLCSGCAGSKPEPAEPAPVDPEPVEPVTDTQPTPGAENATTGGKNVWEEFPEAPHGRCCTSDDECGPIRCEPYKHAISNCTHVCTYACNPGDLCPKMGGTFGPPIPCPEDGLCPVGPPYV